MIKIEVNGKKYKIIGFNTVNGNYEPDWSEITIDKAVELKKHIDANCPEKLLDHYKAITQRGKDDPLIDLDLTYEEKIKIMPTFYGGCFEIMTTIPKDIINQIKWSQRETFYHLYLEYFVFHLLYTDYSVKAYNAPYFTHNNVKYYLPEEEEALGVMIPAYDTTAVEFTQSADIMVKMKKLEGGNIEALKTITAIYCRPKGEKYDEKKALQRAKEFGTLPMTIAMGVFFYTYESVLSYTKDILTSSAEAEALKLSKRSKNQDWKSLVGLLRSQK